MNKNIFKNLLIFSFFLVLSCASGLKFQQMDYKEKDSDWRSFREGQYNLASREVNVPLPLKLIWKEKVGPSYSTPLVLDEMVIIGSLDNKIIFLDFTSGEKLGSYSLSYPLSITPCVDDSLLYFPGEKGNTALFALNLRKGELVWDRKLQGVSSSPVVLEEKLYLGTEKGELLCLDKENGNQLWKYKTDGFVYSTPAINEEALYFGSGDKKVYCLDANSGDLVWRYRTTGAIYSSPCMNDKALYLGSADGYFYALELFTGKLLWKFRTAGSIHSSAVLGKGMVFFGSNDGYLYALSSKDGELAWSFKTDGPIHSSPIIVGEKIFFGSLDGNFYGLSVPNGAMVFKHRTGGMIYASPSFSKGRILIPSTDRYLYSFGNE